MWEIVRKILTLLAVYFGFEFIVFCSIILTIGGFMRRFIFLVVAVSVGLMFSGVIFSETVDEIEKY